MLDVTNIGKVYEPPTGFMRLVIRTALDSPVQALTGVDFQAKPGEIVGIVGPNGAGKSTLIRLIANLVLPTTGTITIDGNDVSAGRSTHRSIGLLLGDERSLYWRLTGQQNLEFFGAMAGLDKATAHDRAAVMMHRNGLADRDRRVFGYSAGMRVQLGLARAMLHEPSLLILDEPSRSLDPVASARLLDQLRERAAGGATILLASHRLEEVEAVCDRVLVLIGGQQRFWGATSELASAASGAAVALRELLENESSQ